MSAKPKAKKPVTFDNFFRAIQEDLFAIRKDMATKDDIRKIREAMATKAELREVREDVKRITEVMVSKSRS